MPWSFPLLNIFRGNGQASAPSGQEAVETSTSEAQKDSPKAKTRASEDGPAEAPRVASSSSGSASKASRKKEKQASRPKTPEFDDEISDDELLLTSSTSRSRESSVPARQSLGRSRTSRNKPTYSQTPTAKQSPQGGSPSNSHLKNGPAKPVIQARKAQKPTAASSRPFAVGRSGQQPPSSPVLVVASRTSSSPVVSSSRAKSDSTPAKKDKGKGRAQDSDEELPEPSVSTMHTSTVGSSQPAGGSKSRKRQREITPELEVAPHISPAKKKAKTAVKDQPSKATTSTTGRIISASPAYSTVGAAKNAPKASPAVSALTAKDKGKGRAVQETFKEPARVVSSTSNATSGSKNRAGDTSISSTRGGEEGNTSQTALAWPKEAKFTSLSQLRDSSADVKPNYAYWVLIRAAILDLAAEAQPVASTSASSAPSGIVGNATLEDILKAICCRYPYYLTGLGDGSLDKAIRQAAGRYRCLIHKKDAFGIVRWSVDTTINPAEKPPKAMPAVINTAAINSREASHEQIQAANEPYRPKPLPRATHSMFATSLTHLPDIPKDQPVPFGLFTIARATILGSPYRRLPQEDIYNEIVAKYPQLVLVPRTETGGKAEQPLVNMLRDVLYNHECFFRIPNNAPFGRREFTVDLWTDPRERSTTKSKGLRKKTKEGHYADPAKCSLQEIETELAGLQSFYEERERKAARRVSTLQSLEGPVPVIQPQAPLVARPPSTLQAALTSTQAGLSVPARPAAVPLRLSPEQKAVAAQVAETLSAEYRSAQSSSGTAQARAGTPELEEPARSASVKKQKKKEEDVKKPQRYKPGTVALREIRRFTPELEDVTAGSGASTSDPGSLEFSDPSRARKGSSASLGPDTPIELSSDSSSSGSDTERPRSSSPEAEAPLVNAAPVANYVCGYMEHRTGKMCEIRFSNAQDRATHLRYTHGQKNESLDIQNKMKEKAEFQLREKLLKMGMAKKAKAAKAKAAKKVTAAASNKKEVVNKQSDKKIKSSGPVPVKGKKKQAREPSAEL